MVIGPIIRSKMENNDQIVPPHLNAEVYRTDTTGTLTQSHWDYIRHHPDGNLLIGCSELTGRYWDGGVIIATPEQDEEINTSTKKAISMNSGTPDGLFLGSSKKVLLCEDSGALSIWSCSDDVWKLWLGDISVAEHDDAIMAVDCVESCKEYVTVGADGNIKVWDINEMVSVRSYNAAHSMAINAVSVRPNSSTFATVSSDQYVSLWDHNTFKPISDLLKNDCGVRCAQWLDENKLIFGDEAGILKLVDIRNPEAAFKLTTFPAAVHRVAIQSESNKVAVCCDNKIVTVCDVSEDSNLRVIYQNRDMHTNYVRGLSWNQSDKNILYSVGYDGVLKTHNITSNDG